MLQFNIIVSSEMKCFVNFTPDSVCFLSSFILHKIYLNVYNF